MSKASWPKWFKTSIAKHFTENASGVELWVEGTNRPRNQSLNRFELRINGPSHRTTDAEVFYIEIGIDLLVMTKFDQNNPTIHETNVGIGLDIFKPTLCIKKWGDGDGEFGFISQQNLPVTKFESEEPVIVEYTTIAGLYTMTKIGES